jgi:hypothetical protein
LSYLLDTNVFIQAHRVYYPIDLFPVFWEWLTQQNLNDNIKSIDQVYNEIKNQKDELSEWCKSLDNKKWFLSVSDDETQEHFRIIANWIMSQNFKDSAKQIFLSVADPWLIAKAMSCDLTIVTQEKSAPQSKSKIYIPDVCNFFSVPYTNTIGMIRNLGGKF